MITQINLVGQWVISCVTKQNVTDISNIREGAGLCLLLPENTFTNKTRFLLVGCSRLTLLSWKIIKFVAIRKKHSNNSYTELQVFLLQEDLTGDQGGGGA